MRHRSGADDAPNVVFILEVRLVDSAERQPPAATYGVVARDRDAALTALGCEVHVGAGAGVLLLGELDAVSAGIFSLDLDQPGQVKRIMRHNGDHKDFWTR